MPERINVFDIVAHANVLSEKIHEIRSVAYISRMIFQYYTFKRKCQR